MSMGGIWLDRSASILRGLMEQMMWQTVAVVRLPGNAAAIEVEDLAGYEHIRLYAYLPVDVTSTSVRVYLRLNDDDGASSYRTGRRQDLGNTALNLSDYLEVCETSNIGAGTGQVEGYLQSPNAQAPRSWWAFDRQALLASHKRWHAVGRWVRDNAGVPPNEAIDKLTLWPATGWFNAGAQLYVQGVVRP